MCGTVKTKDSGVELFLKAEGVSEKGIDSDTFYALNRAQFAPDRSPQSKD